MARIAVIFSVLFSILLLSHARHPPYVPDGGGDASSVPLPDPQEVDGDRVAIPLQLEERPVDGSGSAINIPDQVGLTLRGPMKIRCRHAATRLPFGHRYRTRVIPLGDGVAGFPRGFPGERRPFPTWSAGDRDGFRQEVQRLTYGTAEPGGHHGWIPKKMKHEEEEEEREEGGFRKRFRKHKEERKVGGFSKWFRKQKKSFKKRIGEFLNRF